MRVDTRYQFIIDILDIWIPASNLGLTNVNDGVVGLAGFVAMPCLDVLTMLRRYCFQIHLLCYGYACPVERSECLEVRPLSSIETQPMHEWIWELLFLFHVQLISISVLRATWLVLRYPVASVCISLQN
jgi:hypothetical protein